MAARQVEAEAGAAEGQPSNGRAGAAAGRGASGCADGSSGDAGGGSRSPAGPRAKGSHGWSTASGDAERVRGFGRFGPEGERQAVQPADEGLPRGVGS